MRNKSKITTLESKFPLLSVEQGCMVSKDADITVAFRVELPELFTVTSTEYEAMHSAWHKAIKVLPNYSIVHKQDWFIKEDYKGKLSDGGLSFLARSSERHFNERLYLHHSVYLFLTKTNKQRMAQQSNFSSLCRGHLLPKEITNKDEVMKFMEAVDQFERIINDTEQIRIVRMTEEELIGTKEKGGLLDRYFSLSEEGHASLEDIRLGADLVRVGDNMLCLHTLSDTDDLPTTVSTDSRYERLSTDRSDCRLSFASPVGLMLPCNHIYNQYLFIEDSDANLERFEKQARNMHSLARYSRSNQINEEWIQEYLNIAHSQGLTSIRAHFNVLAKFFLVATPCQYVKVGTDRCQPLRVGDIEILLYPLLVDLVATAVACQRVHVSCLLLESFQVGIAVLDKEVLVIDMHSVLLLQRDF